MCGDIEYEAFFEDTQVPASGADPLNYNDATRRFTCDTSRTDLLGLTKPYRIDAYLKDYRSEATTDTATDTGDVTFIDPCLSPFTSSATTQTTAAPSDNYSDTKKTKVIDDFVVTPSRCTYTYSCASVVGVAPATGLTCADLDFATVNGEVSY